MIHCSKKFDEKKENNDPFSTWMDLGPWTLEVTCGSLYADWDKVIFLYTFGHLKRRLI